jgi:asparagine synthase (glutamine-hydrolysing)
MAKTMGHRGPNSTGIYVSKDKKTGLAHDRLSIIDLSDSANQPMRNEDATLWLVFNGEIYNFRELRAALLERGHRFRSKSDPEVILHLFEEKGIDLLEDLNGMFAFCLFDEVKNEFFLARDRVGIKPLYYYAKNGIFAFSSELKALLTLPQVKKEIDMTGLDYYFTLGYIPEDLSIFQDIRKLRPGHYLHYDGSQMRIERYWQLDSQKIDLSSASEMDLVEMLEEKLNDAVKIRMVSDVPIGTFLSGGLDSSLVTTFMAQAAGRPVNTFTIGFGSNEYDETAFARLIAESIGSIHREHPVHLDAIDMLDKLIFHFDEPFADSSLIPTYYISRAAKENVTVILSGDGGDELFGGYNWYSWVLLVERLKKKLGMASGMLSNLGDILPDRVKHKHLLSVLRLEQPDSFLERVLFFNDKQKSRLYANDLKRIGSQGHPRERFLHFFNGTHGDLIEKMSITDFHYYLPEDILTKVDRASMAVSLETRVPWLDHRLVEFAYSVPSSLKIRNGRKKYLPKKLAEKVLPKNFPVERKQGFCVPLSQWMRDRMGDMLEEELHDKSLSQYLNISYVREILNNHRKHENINHGPRLFSVLIFALWHKKFIRKS